MTNDFETVHITVNLLTLFPFPHIPLHVTLSTGTVALTTVQQENLEKTVDHFTVCLLTKYTLSFCSLSKRTVHSLDQISTS